MPIGVHPTVHMSDPGRARPASSGIPQVDVQNDSPSHISPGSMMPLPQKLGIVVLVVLVVEGGAQPVPLHASQQLVALAAQPSVQDEGLRMVHRAGAPA